MKAFTKTSTILEIRRRGEKEGKKTREEEEMKYSSRAAAA